MFLQMHVCNEACQSLVDSTTLRDLLLIYICIHTSVAHRIQELFVMPPLGYYFKELVATHFSSPRKNTDPTEMNTWCKDQYEQRRTTEGIRKCVFHVFQCAIHKDVHPS